MWFSSALASSVFLIWTSGSALAYCDNPLGCMPTVPSMSMSTMPGYGNQPRFNVAPVAPSQYVAPRYVPDDSTRQLDQDLQNLNRALIYNGQRNHY